MPQFNDCLWDGTNPGDAVPYEEYTASGSTGPFVIGFPYQHENDIVVYIESGGTYTKLNGSNESSPGFSFGINANNENQITLTTAATGQVHIVRRTELCENEAEFEPGASIRAEDLNDTFTQMRNAIIENREMLRAANGGGDIPEVDTNRVSAGTGIDIAVDAGPPRTQQISVESQTIWGQAHDHSAAVTGNMTNVGDITFQAGGGDLNGVANEDIHINTSGTGIFDVDRNTDIAGTLDVSGNVDFDANLDVDGDTELDNVNVDGTVSFSSGDDYTFPQNDGGTGTVLTTDGSGTLTWTSKTLNSNTTYEISSVADSGNVNIRLTGANPASQDDVLMTAGSGVTFTSISDNGFTINAGGGGADVDILADVAALNSAADGPPSDGDLFLLLDSTNLQATGGSSPNNEEDVNGLPETAAAGQPVGGYGSTIQVTLSWDNGNTRWQFVRWSVQSPDNRYVLEQGDTMTGSLVFNDGKDDNITLKTDGSAYFADTITSKADARSGANVGVYIDGPSGAIVAAATGSNAFLRGFQKDGSENITLKANGSAEFAGTVNAGVLNSSYKESFSTGVPSSAITLQADSPTGDANSGNTILFRPSSAGLATINAVCETTGASASATALTFQTRNTGGTTSEAARITSDNNVLIGGTLPSAPNITLNSNGLGEFDGGVKVSGGTSATVENGMWFNSNGLQCGSRSSGADVHGLSVSHVGDGSTATIASSLKILKGAKNSSTRNDYRGIYIPDIKTTVAGEAVYGLYSDIGTSPQTNYNFYVAGAAPNWFKGNTLIGGTAADPNITLDGSNGSAEFDGTVLSNNLLHANRQSNFVYIGGAGMSRNDLRDNASLRLSNNDQSVAGTASIIAVQGKGANTNSGYSFLSFVTPGNSGGNYISLASTLQGSSTADEVLRIDSDGSVGIGGTPGTSPNIELNADGGAQFSATVNVGSPNSTSATGARVSFTGQIVGNLQDESQKGLIIKALNQEKVVINSDGSGIFTGNITAGNVTFNLEPDNDANYTVTTSTDEEDNEVENRVYNGPTLDVKETLTTLLSRIATLESNTTPDMSSISELTTKVNAIEAENSLVATLVQNISARLDSIDDAITALQNPSTPQPEVNLIPDEWSQEQRIAAMHELLNEYNSNK